MVSGVNDKTKPKGGAEISEHTTIKHITNLRDTRADDMICLSYGKLDLEEDPACDNIFHTNWGALTLFLCKTLLH